MCKQVSVCEYECVLCDVVCVCVCVCALQTAGWSFSGHSQASLYEGSQAFLMKMGPKAGCLVLAWFTPKPGVT